MSEANVEVVRRLFAQIATGDWHSPELLQLYEDVMGPDFELELSGSWFPDAGVHKGLGPAIEAWDKFLEAWEVMTPTKPELVDGGDRVVAFYRIRGKGRGSGVPVEAKVGAIATFREGKVVRLNLCDRAEALEASGLSE